MKKKVIVSVIGLIGLVTIAFGCGAFNAKAKGENTVQNITNLIGKSIYRLLRLVQSFWDSLQYPKQIIRLSTVNQKPRLIILWNMAQIGISL